LSAACFIYYNRETGVIWIRFVKSQFYVHMNYPLSNLILLRQVNASNNVMPDWISLPRTALRPCSGW
jgi:hypothetical protein